MKAIDQARPPVRAMSALLENLEELGRLWGERPERLLALSGLSPALYYQWRGGQAARIDKLEQLADRLGLTCSELLRPGTVSELGSELVNPFARARAIADEQISARASRSRGRSSSSPSIDETATALAAAIENEKARSTKRARTQNLYYLHPYAEQQERSAETNPEDIFVTQDVRVGAA